MIFFILYDKSNEEDIPPDLLPLLEEYAGIFEEPVGLFSSRWMEHHIQLKPRSIPKHQYPYITSHSHKDKFEKGVEEMLKVGIIQNSMSLYASTTQLFGAKFFKGLLLDEYWYNNNYHSSMTTTPFQVLYGYPSPHTSVEEVQDSIHPMFGEEGFITMRAVGIVDNHQLNIPFSPKLHKVEGYTLILGRYWFMFCTPIELDYTNMTVFLNGKKVKLMLLTTAIDMKRTTRSVLCSSIHQQIHGLEETGVSNTELQKVTHPQTPEPIAIFYVCLSQYLRVLALNVIQENKEFSKMHQVFHVLIIKRGIRTRIVPVAMLSETDSARYRKIEPFLALNESTITSTYVSFSPILVKWLISGFSFAMLGELKLISHKLSLFDPCGQGSTAAWGIVMDRNGMQESGVLCKKKETEELCFAIGIDSIAEELMVEEVNGREKGQKHEPVQKLPEMDSGGNYKIEPFATIGIFLFTKKGEHTSEFDSDGHSKIELLICLSTRILTRKGEKVAQILLYWLKTRPEFATLEAAELLRRKFPPFDPCGQGSSESRGIVMAHVGVNCGGDGMKKNG